MASSAKLNSMDLCNDWDKDKDSEHNPRTSSHFRFLVITLGPTGAGKSIMARNLKQAAQGINSLVARKPWFEKVLDDYVEDSEIYKREMTAFIEKNEKAGINIYDLDGCSIYEPKWTAFVNEISNIYFKAREEEGLAEIYNAEFNKNIKQGHNIIYEITGKNKLSIIKILNYVLSQTENCRTHKYIILAGYSIVDYYLLQARNISRFQTAYAEFLKGDKPPRLPWVGCFNHRVGPKIMSYCQMLDDIKHTVLELIKCGYVYSPGKYKLQSNVNNENTPRVNVNDISRLSKTGECFLDKTATIEHGRKSVFIPKGLYIDYLYIYNNIYKKTNLMAKINLSERSRFLGNPDNYNEDDKRLAYYEYTSISALVDIIDKTGPPTTADNRVYNVCGPGTALPTHKMGTRANIYLQKNLHKDGGMRNTRRNRNRNISKTRNKRQL